MPSRAVVQRSHDEEPAAAPYAEAPLPVDHLLHAQADELVEHRSGKPRLDAVAEMHELFLSHLKEHNAGDELLALWGDAKEGEGSWAIDYPDKNV